MKLGLKDMKKAYKKVNIDKIEVFLTALLVKLYVSHGSHDKNTYSNPS